MKTHLIALALIICCAILDRCRGSKKLTIISNFFEAMMIGAALACLALTYSDLTGWDVVIAVCGFALLFAVCEWPGWGGPLGAVLYKHEMRKNELERWQVGPLKTNPVFALIARGAIWSSPALLMSAWYSELIYIFVAMSISMPVAVVAAREIGERYKVGNTWRLQEYIRGGMTATLTYLMAWGAV